MVTATQKIPSRYKQTEVGIIPYDWEVHSLEEIVDPKHPICYGIVQVGPHVKDGVSVLAIKNLGTNYLKNIHKSSIEIEAPYVRSRIRPNDVLISVKGTTGRVGIVPKDFSGNISRDLARLRLREKHHPKFWFQMLRSDCAQQKLNVATVGTTRMELSIGILKQIKMPCPPKEEQSAIAEVLGDIDSLIHALECLIVKKRNLKQATMQAILTGKKRLPNFSGKWKTQSLGELASITKGIQLHKREISLNGKHPHLNGGIAPSGYTDKSNALANTIAISEGGNSCGYVQFMTETYWCGGHCYSVIPSNIDNHFLYYALKGEQSAIMALRVGSGLPNVQKTALSAFKLRYPIFEVEQIAIATILVDMDAEIDSIEQKLAKYRMLKQGMMQVLLTGKVRLI